MEYEVFISDEAKEKLRALAKPVRRNIGRKISAMQIDLSGDVKKLKGSTNEYRLRVGDYRVLFELEWNQS